MVVGGTYLSTDDLATPIVQDDVALIQEAGGGTVDYTIGSALDIFGGSLAFDQVV